MKEYKLGIGWKIFLVIASIALMIAGVGWLLTTIIEGSKNAVYFIPLSLLVFAVGAWYLKITLAFRVIINENSISITDNGKTKELRLNEIKGFTSNDKYTILQPIDESRPTVQIPYYTEKYEEIQSWVESKYGDLDIIEEQAEESQILQKEEFGATAEERAANLRSARWVTRILNGAGTGLIFWALLFPQPYLVVCLLCIVFPILILAVYRYYKGLIKINSAKSSAYPGVTAILFVPAILCLRAFIDYDFVDHNNLWLPASVIAIAFAFVLAYNRNEFQLITAGGKAMLGCALVIGLAYGYAVSVFYNCYKDPSTATVYRAQVIDKHVTSGKSRTYNLKISPWITGRDTQEVTIDQSLYNRCNTGQTINIYVQRGRLNAPWYYISD